VGYDLSLILKMILTELIKNNIGEAKGKKKEAKETASYLVFELEIKRYQD
jgi:hypothetical protein